MIVFQSAGWDEQTSRTDDNTSINLMNDAGDCLLHISLRQQQDVIVLNSRIADGNWGPEECERLKGTFLSPSYNIAVVDHGDRYELLVSYQTVHYYAKRLAGLLTHTSYCIKDGQGSSPLSDSLVVSTCNGFHTLALTNYGATSEIQPLDLPIE